MNRRVSKSLVALAFALVLCLSTPSASAATRDGGFDPSFGARIIQLVKGFIHHFIPGSMTDMPSTPKP
jgi:hypothetical protein